MNFLTGMLISYLLGAIPAAYILVRVLKGADIREYGSGNVGATNAGRMLGKPLGLLVLVFDLVKGVLAVTVIAFFFAQRSPVPVTMAQAIYGLAVVCGHVFNVFLQGKGGKGVATGAGVLLGIAPGAMAIGAAIFVIIVLSTKYVSLASMGASFVIPFFMVWARYDSGSILLSAVLCVLIVAKHKSNIKRLMAGQERKVFLKK